jgi:hypothetical protein
MQLRSRKKLKDKLRADFQQAAMLLSDDLVWSGDFDNIRTDLLEMIQLSIRYDSYHPALSSAVQKLIAEENDLSVQ